MVMELLKPVDMLAVVAVGAATPMVMNDTYSIPGRHGTYVRACVCADHRSTTRYQRVPHPLRVRKCNCIESFGGYARDEYAVSWPMVGSETDAAGDANGVVNKSLYDRCDFAVVYVFRAADRSTTKWGGPYPKNIIPTSSSCQTSSWCRRR